MSDKKTRKNYNITAEKFCEVWRNTFEKGGTAQDVADTLEMPKNAVLARYSNYKKTRSDGTPGVPLPQLKRKKSDKALKIDVLTKIVTGKEEAEASTEAAE